MRFVDRFAVHAFVEREGVVAVPDARELGGPLVEAVASVDGSRHARYVRARPLRWHEPLFARIVVTRRRVASGEMLPPWCYALGYFDMVRNESVYFFLGVALAVRALRWIEFFWNRLRSRPSWFDRQLFEARYGRDGR